MVWANDPNEGGQYFLRIFAVFFILVILYFIIFLGYPFEEIVLNNPMLLLIGGGLIIGAVWEHLRDRKQDIDYEEKLRKEEINDLKYEINKLKRKKTTKKKISKKKVAKKKTTKKGK